MNATGTSDIFEKLERMENFVINKATKLQAHTERNWETSHLNHKIYHLLGDPFTFVNAYTKISKNSGALTKGIESDEEIMKFFGLSNAEKLAKKFRENRYQFKPTRRVWIPKPGKSKKRPIDTPTQEDRIVQEALRGILEAIFEPEFQEFEEENNMTCTNYGFRPKKSTFDACSALKHKGQRTTYVIEGDIKGAYPSVNHDILIQILEVRIKDKKFIKLMRQLLESGIMDEGKFEHSLTGTPQGGIVSPLLFNIYMFEFDKFIYQSVFPTILTQTKPQRCPNYQKLGYQMKILRSKIKEANTKEKATLKKEFNKIQKARFSSPSYVLNTLPKDCVYVRYADDWVFMFTGNLDTAKQIKQTLSLILQTNLKL
jgi:group II intron reverse transcriptase/maturase